MELKHESITLSSPVRRALCSTRSILICFSQEGGGVLAPGFLRSLYRRVQGILRSLLYDESCLACQHFISVWLGKLKPNKLSTGCQNQLKEMAAERATNPGRLFLFFVCMHAFFKFRRSVVLPTKPPCYECFHASEYNQVT